MAHGSWFMAHCSPLKTPYLGAFLTTNHQPLTTIFTIYESKLHFCLGPVTRFANSTGARAEKLGQKHVMKQGFLPKGPINIKKGMAIMATITKEKAAEITAKFGANEKDTGNVRVQIALLTEKIKNLTEHAKTHKKDFHSLRGLSMMVSKRKNLLKYYGEKDIVAQRALIKELGLRG